MSIQRRFTLLSCLCIASLVQAQAPGDFGNADSAPDRAASDAAVLRLAGLFKG